MLNFFLDSVSSLLGKDAKRGSIKKQQKPQTVNATKQGDRGNYHCVEVHGGKEACEAVTSLEGNRFLPHEAPALPVPGCNAKKCTCGYMHFDDRRQEDRRNPYRQWAIVLPENTGERRTRNDRRKSAENLFRPSIAS
jgi:hypothetical protein